MPLYSPVHLIGGGEVPTSQFVGDVRCGGVLPTYTQMLGKEECLSPTSPSGSDAHFIALPIPTILQGERKFYTPHTCPSFFPFSPHSSHCTVSCSWRPGAVLEEFPTLPTLPV